MRYLRFLRGGLGRRALYRRQLRPRLLERRAPAIVGRVVAVVVDDARGVTIGRPPAEFGRGLARRLIGLLARGGGTAARSRWSRDITATRAALLRC